MLAEDKELFVQQLAAELVEALAPVLGRADDRPLLSVPQAAERLNISATNMWHIVDRGEIPTVAVGQNRRMVEPAALDSYIAANRSH